jgi:TRAP-type C4-dicarboxylate transport system permease small subunit
MNFFSLLRLINTFLDRCLRVLLVGIFTVLAGVVLWGVASRYLFANQAPWSEELARLLMVWLALPGTALVTREESHLGLDALVLTWPEEVRRLSGLLVHAMVFVFAAGVMAWGGGELVGQRLAYGQILPALGISKAWFYLALPVSGVLTAMFTLELLLNDLRRLPRTGGAS